MDEAVSNQPTQEDRELLAKFGEILEMAILAISESLDAVIVRFCEDNPGFADKFPNLVANMRHRCSPIDAYNAQLKQGRAEAAESVRELKEFALEEFADEMRAAAEEQ